MGASAGCQPHQPVRDAIVGQSWSAWVFALHAISAATMTSSYTKHTCCADVRMQALVKTASKMNFPDPVPPRT